MSMIVRVRAVPCLGLALSLASLSCTKSGDTEAEGAKPEAKEATPAAEGEAPAEAEATPDDPGGLSKTVAEEITAAAIDGRLDRGVALAHVIVPRPSELLGEIRTKVMPPSKADSLDETSLRTLGGVLLGKRAAVANHIALDQPIGCVLVEDTTAELPLACMAGYTGGAAAAVTDLGAEGKQADPAGHAAHYRVDGKDLFLDELGGHVVVTTSPGIFAKAQGYLETNLLARASSVHDDVEAVFFPKAAMVRYAEQIDSVMSLARASSAEPPTGNAVLDAFKEYTRTSMDRGLDTYRETDQFDLGLSLEEVGFVFRYAAYPTPGSGMQADTQAISAGPIDTKLVEQLPAQAWLVTAYTLDWKAAWEMESAAAVRDVVLDAYAGVIGRDPSEVRTAVEGFLESNAELYGKDMAMAVMHLPATQGGIVLSRALDEPARASWKTWSETFAAADVLGPEGSKYVTWSFTPDALEVDGVAVDRWTIEPGPVAKAEIAKKKKTDPVLTEIERRFGGLKLTIDRVELADRVLFVVAPGSQEVYVRAAIAAAKGSTGLGSDPGFTGLMARNPEASTVMAVNVAGALTWAREVLPPDATRKLPTGLGKDLGDAYFALSYGASGSQNGEMVLSQSLIDQLRALAG